MSAQLLYKMIKSKTEYPLHKAIKVEREDVVFLYLIEMDSQVKSPQINCVPFINSSVTSHFYLLCYKPVIYFVLSLVFSSLAN